MKGGPLTVWSVLLAGGLLAAYLTWIRGPSTGSDRSVSILDLEPDEVSALRLETASQTLEIARVEGEWRVSVADRPSPPEASLANESGAAKEPPRPARVEFRANESAGELVSKFAPFVALRDLGALPRERLADLGLDSSEKKLTVVHEGGEDSFDVGRHTYGSANVYLRRRTDGRAYLARAGPLSELEDSRTGLMDRRLHSFALSDVDRAIVSAGARRRELVRRTAADASSFWADAAAPQEPDEFYESWLRRAHQLYVSDLLPHESPPVPTTPIVTIEYFQGATKRGRLELHSEPAGEGSAKRFRARTEHTLRWVRVIHAQADAVARDVDNVLSP